MTAEMQTVLNNAVNDGKARLIDGYINTGRRASGQFERELEGEYKERVGGFTITYKGSKHAYWMDKGRKPNKNQDDEAIRKWVGWYGSSVLTDWVRNKNISANPYAVAYKVAREGYAAKPFISDAISIDWVTEITKDVAGVFLARVSNDIKQFLKQDKK
jgi:hypothetical protein